MQNKTQKDDSAVIREQQGFHTVDPHAFKFCTAGSLTTLTHVFSVCLPSFDVWRVAITRRKPKNCASFLSYLTHIPNFLLPRYLKVLRNDCPDPSTGPSVVEGCRAQAGCGMPVMVCLWSYSYTEGTGDIEIDCLSVCWQVPMYPGCPWYANEADLKFLILLSSAIPVL